MWKQALWGWAFASLPSLGLAAPSLATATIVEGDFVLIRDATLYGLAEGARLQKDDIVQSNAAGRFMRFEFADGVIVDLAPNTRVMLSPKAGTDRGKIPPRLYLLQGTVKLSVPANVPASGTVLASANLDLPAVAKGVVVSAMPGETAAFAESGSIALVERRDFKPQPSQSLRSGQFYARTGDGKAQIVARPSSPFIQSLPKAFLDTLPPRLELFKGRDVLLKPSASSIAYADVQPWIDAEPALRPQFMARWRVLTKSPEFRAGLVAGMQAHPEWDRLLFPERYRPKAQPGGTTHLARQPAP